MLKEVKFVGNKNLYAYIEEDNKAYRKVLSPYQLLNALYNNDITKLCITVEGCSYEVIEGYKKENKYYFIIND